MKVLMISGDRTTLTPGTSAHERLELQRSRVEQLDIFVWPQAHSRHDIFRAVKKNKYDVVTAQDPFWRGLLGWRAARRVDARLNVQVHTDLTAYSFFRRALARFVLHRADSVRVVSEKIKKQVEEMGVRASVSVLPVFVDVDRFRTMSHQPHAQETVLWVGRFESEKSPEEAIEVLRNVRKIIDAKLIMLGSGSLKESLKKGAQGLPVEFPGWQDPLPYMEVSDVVLCTSLHESWGASIIEALAAGVTVVAPDVGIAEEAGALVVPRLELASAVARVLQSGERGALALKLLSAEEWAERWRETLV